MYEDQIITNPNNHTIQLGGSGQSTPPPSDDIERQALPMGARDGDFDHPDYSDMYHDEDITNPDERTIQLSGDPNETSPIRIDDTSIGTRQTWSSQKISEYAQKSNEQLIAEYVAQYGTLYFSEYDQSVHDDWTPIIADAVTALNSGDTFYVAWSEKRIAEVINADSDSEPRMTVVVGGRAYAMSDVGIFEVPAYRIVMQYPSVSNFPQTGSADRVYIDSSTDAMYYWNGSYRPIKSGAVLHKLTFGANQEFVYDGSEDVTVPVYMGTFN